MSGLLPSSSEPETPDGEPRVIGVDEEDADDVLAALSSETARSLFAAVHDQPATPSELADRTDTSLQNAQYHLEKLTDADLVEVVDTRYSEKGREMKVLGPSGAPVVLFAGSEEETGEVRSAITSLLGGVGLLGLASLALQQFAGAGIGALFAAREAGDAGGSDMSAMSVEQTTTATAEAAGQYQAEIASQVAGLPPGVLFFVGGAFVLALAAIWWYVRR